MFVLDFVIQDFAPVLLRFGCRSVVVVGFDIDADQRRHGFCCLDLLDKMNVRIQTDQITAGVPGRVIDPLARLGIDLPVWALMTNEPGRLSSRVGLRGLYSSPLQSPPGNHSDNNRRATANAAVEMAWKSTDDRELIAYPSTQP